MNEWDRTCTRVPLQGTLQAERYKAEYPSGTRIMLLSMGRGIHAFIASGVLDYRQLIKSQRYIFNFIKESETHTGYLPIIDFGGGLGIDYSNEQREFDIERYGIELKRLINEFGFSNRKIIMELGTYLVGNAGYYTAKIIDIKKIKGKKHIILAGGVNHMGLPLEMRRKHPVEIVPMDEQIIYQNQPEVHEEIVDISGPLCMVSDKLSWDEYVRSARIGDVAVLLQSGAYCYEEGMHRFLMHMKPNEEFIPAGYYKERNI